MIDFLSDSVGTKGWGMFFVILSGLTMLTKLYLENQAEVHDVLKSGLAH